MLNIISKFFTSSDVNTAVSTLNDSIGVISVVGALLLAVVGFAVYFVRKKNIFIKTVLVPQNDKSLRKAEKLRFSVYHKPTLKVGEFTYTYENFKKEILNEKPFVMVHAPSGYGKTSLMKKLAYDYSKKIMRSKVKNQTDLGICYISANASTTVADIVNKLSEIVTPQDISVFIDGFDRINEFATANANVTDESVCEYLAQIVKNKLFKRIVISFRTELMSENMSGVESFSVGPGEEQSEVVLTSISRFIADDVVKTLKKYLSKPELCKDYLMTSTSGKLTSKERKAIYKDIYDMLEKNRISLFSIPVFIPFIPLVFSKYEESQRKKLTKFDIIKVITEQYFARELKLTARNGVAQNKEQCIKDGVGLLSAIVREMNKDTLSYADRGVAAEKIKTLAGVMNMGNFASGHILKYAGSAKGFEFLHQNFYEYFLCTVILDDIKTPETPYETLSAYYEFIANAPKSIKELYYQAVYSEFKNKLSYVSFTDFYGNVMSLNGAVFNDCGYTLDRLLLMLPSIKKIIYNGLHFDADFIEALAEDRKLLIDINSDDAKEYPAIISANYVQSMEFFNYASDTAIFEEMLVAFPVRNLTVQTDSKETLYKFLNSDDIDTLVLNISDYSPLYPEIYRIIRNNETTKSLSIKSATKAGGLADKKDYTFLKEVFYVDYTFFPLSSSLEPIAFELTDKLHKMLKAGSGEEEQAKEIIYEIKTELDSFSQLFIDSVKSLVQENFCYVYGLCLYNLEEYEKALPLFKSACEWYEKQGRDDLFANDRRYWYGCCLLKLNEYDKAKPLLQSACEWCEKKGRNDKFASDCRYWYGLCLYEFKEYETALPLLKSAYEWYETNLGSDDKDTNHCRYWYGLCLYGLEEYENAKPLLKSVYEWCEINLGSDDKDTNNRRYWYSLCLYRLEEYEKAKPLFKSAYEWCETNLVSDDEYTNECRYWYGKCLYRLEEYENALPLFKSVCEWCETNLGSDDKDTNQCRYWYGKCLFEIEGSELEGLSHISEVYEKRKMIDPDIGVKFYGNGYIVRLIRLGRDAEAEEIQKDLNEILKSRFGIETENAQ